MTVDRSADDKGNPWRPNQFTRLIRSGGPSGAWSKEKLRYLIARDIRVARQVGHLPSELLTEQTRIDIQLDVLFDDRLEQVVYVRTIATRSREKGLIQGIEILSKLRRIEDLPRAEKHKIRSSPTQGECDGGGTSAL